MRQQTSNGLCPVLDQSPSLLPENLDAVAIWEQVKFTGEMRDMKHGSNYKTAFFVRPTDILAMMDIHSVHKKLRPRIYEKILKLQEIENGYQRPKEG